ncbi:MAG: PAS domain S-box protein, partial [Desulfobacteraceae bacterium]|nr:PAS domain S-box protein [Desulfobacteraceae bacterium]
GEWEFYWNQLLSPKDFQTDRSTSLTGFFNIPGSWNYYQNQDKSFAGHGYATYRLKIKLKKGKAYAVKILPISTAYRIWIDNELLSVGKVGKTREDMIPQFAVKILRFYPDTPETQIVLQVSNFYHRSGGPWRAIEIGTYQQIADQRIKSFAFDLFLIGAILMMGLYHFGLFILRKKDVTTLYFGLLCLVVVVRTFVTSEHVFYFLFPDFNWLIAYKFEYLSFYIGIPLAVFFINNLFPDESLKITSEISSCISIIFSVSVIFTQPQVFSHTVVTYEIITLMSLLYMIFVISRAVFKKRSGSILVAVGSVIAIAAVINDILYANEVITSFYMAPIGLLFFILFHSLNLSMKFSKAFSNIEIIEEKYRSIFENSLDGISQISFSDKTFIANPALAHMLGYSSPEEFPPLLKKVWQRVFVDDRVCDQYFNELKVNKKVADFEAAFHHKNGKPTWVSLNSKATTDKNNNILLIDSIVHDITHRKEKEMLEAKILQVQKMEAIGHLAGGIAHDFNNIISAISSNTQVLIVNKDNNSNIKDRKFQNIIDACDRARSLINQILTFSRKSRHESFKPIRIDSIIKEVTRFIRSTIPETIKIEQEINSQSFRILSDSTQIYQIIMNLYYNAIDAMEKEGGVLKVTLLPVETEDMKISTGYLSKGDYVELAVSDTGEGMPPEILRNIFDPYYTTKEHGKGTGLGLATVHGIVKSHGGEILVKSEPGKGTIFKLYFPITDKEEQKKEY